MRPGCLDASKVLVTPRGRVLIGSLGVFDALEGEVAPELMQQAVKDDLAALGQLVLTVSCGGFGPYPGTPCTLDQMAGSGRYSPQLVSLVGSLLASGEGGPVGSARQLCCMLGDHISRELEMQMQMGDSLLRDLEVEMENGRIARILIKIGA